MTMPVFKAAGTLVSALGTATANPAWPTGHAAGDFGLLFVENDDQNIATPSGWTAVAGMPVRNVPGGNDTVLQIFRRFATSAAETAPSIAALNHCSGVILTWTGVNTANPIHMVSTHIQLTSGTARACPGLTTYIDDCLIIAAYSWHLDSAGPLSSTETNPQLSGLVERFDGGTTDGNGGGLVVIEGGLAAQGTIGPTTVTFSSSAAVAMACLALQAADKTFGRRSRWINTEM